jgi:hypothetical protein
MAMDPHNVSHMSSCVADGHYHCRQNQWLQTRQDRPAQKVPPPQIQRTGGPCHRSRSGRMQSVTTRSPSISQPNAEHTHVGLGSLYLIISVTFVLAALSRV